MGRGSSKAGGGGGAKTSATSAIDASKLSDDEITRINARRSDVIRSAVVYARTTRPVQAPNLTSEQSALLRKVKNNDFSSLENASPKALKAVSQQVEHEYDSVQRRLAESGYNYDVRNDYTTDRSGRKHQTGDFPSLYQARQESEKQSIEIQAALDRKSKPEREITTGTYKRAMKKGERDVQNFMGKRR